LPKGPAPEGFSESAFQAHATNSQGIPHLC
jgi:hypothetical protein